MSIYHRESFVSNLPVHDHALDKKTNRCFDEVVNFLTEATRRAIKSREKQKKSHCDIRGNVFFDITTYASSTPTPISSHFCLSRKSDRFDDHHFKDFSYHGTTFVVPLGIEECVLLVKPIFVLCDENALVPDGKGIGRDVSKRLFATANRMLTEVVFDCRIYHDVSETGSIVALSENAKKVLLENRGAKPGAEEFKKLARTYGFEGVAYECTFLEAREELLKDGELKGSP